MMRLLTIIKEQKFLLLILLLGAILRLYHIDYQSVWLDEIHTINEANPNLSWLELYETILNAEPHPPLYFIVARLIFSIFGYTTLVIRVLSALIGIAGIYALFLLGKELFNKKTGLIAALVLAVNYFHIYYSQEARMYVLFFLFTVLAFYRLVIYLKTPSFKQALWFGLFSSLMIYCHFFALFALVAQYGILLYFIVHVDKEKRKKLLWNSVIVGVLTIICYLPVTPMIIASMSIKSIWINPPTVDSLTQIFAEFFDHSEVLVSIVSVCVFYYLVTLFRFKSKEINKPIFAFIVLFFWVAITVLIPYIRSYVSLPLIVSRYFINVLPVVVLVVASAIYLIQNKNVRVIVLSSFVLLSIVDLVIVKKYYHVVNKTQFRELTAHFLDKKEQEEKLVTSLGWYFNFHTNGNVDSTTVLINQPLDRYISQVKSGQEELETFWYADAHIRPYNPSVSTSQFIDQNYIIENELNLYDCHIKKFTLKSEFVTEANLEPLLPLIPQSGDVFPHSFESFEVVDNMIQVYGWAFYLGQDASDTQIDVIAINGSTGINLPVHGVLREDLSTYFKIDYTIDQSGFSIKSKLPQGTYNLLLRLRCKKTNKDGYIISKKQFSIK